MSTEPIAQEIETRKVQRAMAEAQVIAFKILMSDLGYCFVLGYAPADRLEDFTAETNLAENDPRENAFVTAVTKAAQLMSAQSRTS